MFYEDGRVPSLQLRIIFPPTMPIRSDGNILRRPRRRSRSLFFGNMPDTACRMIYTTMGHLQSLRIRGIGHETHFFRMPFLHVFIRCLF